MGAQTEVSPAPFAAGTEVGGGLHAIPHAYAERAQAKGGRYAETGTVCGRRARLAPAVGAFDRALLPSWATVCPACAWIVALETGTVDQELDALTPTGQNLAAMARLMADPLITRHTCEAIIAASRAGADGLADPATVEALAHATRHAPAILWSEACLEGECGHPADACPVMAACAACSLRAGDWSQDGEGHYLPLCTITAPCQVLTTLARTLGLLPEAS
ncbi:hypothetical protein [Streptosporangium sp. NPDC051022]|uniref:hypothetical protein n=1 Tax=Streptosporangium sp. NPDC051022 TaxID=3155752 RepID=UPI00342F2D02